MEPHKSEPTHACCFRITLYIWTSGNLSQNNSVKNLVLRRVWMELSQRCCLERVEALGQQAGDRAKWASLITG